MAVVPFRRPMPYPALQPDLPEDVAREIEWGMQRAFPRDLPLSASDPGLWLQYQVLLKDDEFAEYGVVLRELVGWISDRGQRVGMIKLDEWHLDPFLKSDRTFWEVADAHSAATADFGQALLSAWPIRRLAERGSLVELSWVWMHPDHAARSLWAMAVRALMRQRYAARYVGPQPDGVGEAGAEGAWGAPLSRGCPEGDRWWQWRALRDGVPGPRRRRLTWL